MYWTEWHGASFTEIVVSKEKTCVTLWLIFHRALLERHLQLMNWNKLSWCVKSWIWKNINDIIMKLYVQVLDGIQTTTYLCYLVDLAVYCYVTKCTYLKYLYIWSRAHEYVLNKCACIESCLWKCMFAWNVWDLFSWKTWSKIIMASQDVLRWFRFVHR